MTDFPEYKTVSTDSLIPYARNSRTHSDEQVAQIAASIKEFGFLNPIIIDGDNSIIAGHGRVMAAQKIGIKSCRVLRHRTYQTPSAVRISLQTIRLLLMRDGMTTCYALS